MHGYFHTDVMQLEISEKKYSFIYSILVDPNCRRFRSRILSLFGFYSSLTWLPPLESYHGKCDITQKIYEYLNTGFGMLLYF